MVNSCVEMRQHRVPIANYVILMITVHWDLSGRMNCVYSIKCIGDDILTKIRENNILFSLVRSHLLCVWILFEFNDKICVSMKLVSSFSFSSWGIHGKHFPSFKLEDDHSHRFVDRLCYGRSINDNFNSIKQLNIITSKNTCCVSFYVRKNCFFNGVNCSRQQEQEPKKLLNKLSII